MTETEHRPRDTEMYRRAYMDVQAVLDEALGTGEEDGAGEGIAADVALVASQRDQARREAGKAEAELAGERECGARLARGLRGLIRQWRAESANWDGFTVEGDDYRNGGFAERAERYAACADAVETLLAECGMPVESEPCGEHGESTGRTS